MEKSRRRRAISRLEVLGGGSFSPASVGAIGAFVIERKFTEASHSQRPAPCWTFFGFMHGKSIGVG